MPENNTTIFGKPLETLEEKNAFKNGLLVGLGVAAIAYILSKMEK